MRRVFKKIDEYGNYEGSTMKLKKGDIVILKDGTSIDAMYKVTLVPFVGDPCAGCSLIDDTSSRCPRISHEVRHVHIGKFHKKYKQPIDPIRICDRIHRYGGDSYTGVLVDMYKALEDL